MHTHTQIQMLTQAYTHARLPTHMHTQMHTHEHIHTQCTYTHNAYIAHSSHTYTHTHIQTTYPHNTHYKHTFKHYIPVSEMIWLLLAVTLPQPQIFQVIVAPSHSAMPF